MRKARYVRSQAQTRPHECHWPGCTEQVPPAMWGCRQHWFMLPAEIRSAIWFSYRPGQEADMRPSAAYLDAARKAREWIMARKTASQHESQAPAAAASPPPRGHETAFDFAPLQVCLDADMATDVNASVLSTGRGQIYITGHGYCFGLTMSLPMAQRFARGMEKLLDRMQKAAESKEGK